MSDAAKGYIRSIATKAAILSVRTEADAAAARPRWKDGTPKKLVDGQWRTDWRAVLDENHDRERMQEDGVYAAQVYAALGGGDPVIGRRRWQLALDDEIEEGREAAMNASKSAGGPQSEWDQGGREKHRAAMTLRALETEHEELGARIEAARAAMQPDEPKPDLPVAAE